jgi:ectoine hydroxylase-related dioxygenase (phytanoyl-CoA dioxygenase family)
MNIQQPRANIWRGDTDTPDPFAEIARLGLQQNVAEFEAHGYTVIPPEKASTPDFVARLSDAILKVAENRNGVRPDRVTGDSHRNLPTAAGQHLFNLLLEGQPFEEAMMNETVLAMISYAAGHSVQISSMTAMVKGPGTVKLDLHSDILFMPPPYPAWASGVNATWALTDYSQENGSTCFWPGSHKFCRQPTAAEREDIASLVPVKARAGSLIVWHSNTWHGAFARTVPGLRINLIMFFSRPFFIRQEQYEGQIAPEVIDRNGPRFAQLIGKMLPFPMSQTGPDYERLATMNAATRTLWG